MRPVSWWPLGLVLASTTVAHATTVTGVLRERGTRAPIVDTVVYALPSKLRTRTDGAGRFKLEGVPSGPVQWVVNASGYRRLTQDDLLSASLDGVPSEVLLYLERANYSSFETTVYAKEAKRDDTTRSIKASEISQIAGAMNDPVKAVQNLPGVNRPSSFSSQVIIQGSAPEDTRYLIEGHEVPIIFHFGGLSSVVIPEALDRVDYLSAGYGPEFGRAIGGQVGVYTKTPRNDRWGGFAFVDTFNAGFMIEGPVGDKSSLLIGGRQSYIGSVLKAVAKNDSGFNLTLAPRFSDTVIVYESEVTPIDQFRLVTVGSLDHLEFLLDQPVGQDPAIRGGFENQTAFFRIIPTVTHRHGAHTVSRWSVGLGKDWLLFDAGSNFFKLNSFTTTQRVELEQRLTPGWTSQWGMDNALTRAHVSILVPNTFVAGGVRNPLSTGVLTRADLVSSYTKLGFYWRNEFKFPGEKLTLLPSLREDYFSATSEAVTQPRLAARFALSESLSLRSSGGLYVQPPREQEVDATFGNPAIRSPRAWHATVGLDKDFRQGTQGFVLTQGLFYKALDRLITQSTAQVLRDGMVVAENYTNAGSGRVIGAETQLRYDLGDWSGWLAYTLSRSTRNLPGQGEYLFGYDQTHLLTLLATVELGRHWKLSGRFRYTTGDPTTPIVGAEFDADRDVYVPVRGAFYSQRLDPFAQLDLRAEKKWVFNQWILTAYLDLQNATNRQNLETVQYAYDYSANEKVAGLPIIPTFGVKGEF